MNNAIKPLLTPSIVSLLDKPLMLSGSVKYFKRGFTDRHKKHKALQLTASALLVCFWFLNPIAHAQDTVFIPFVDNAKLELVCTSAGGTWDAGECTAADITSDNESVCILGGGTWSDFSCHAPPPRYNCWVGGFCSKAAEDISLPTIQPYPNWVNKYIGHKLYEEPARSACQDGLGAGVHYKFWYEGEDIHFWVPDFETVRMVKDMCGR